MHEIGHKSKLLVLNRVKITLSFEFISIELRVLFHLKKFHFGVNQRELERNKCYLKSRKSSIFNGNTMLVQMKTEFKKKKKKMFANKSI